MKNNTKTIITIEMNNVDHANKFKNALENFFAQSDMGGDCFLACSDGWRDVKCEWLIGHDVRKPKIDITFDESGS